MVSLDFLKKVSLFKGLNEGRLRKIQEGCRELEYKEGERLFAEDEDARFIWIVLHGRVDIRFDLPGRDSSEESTVYSETATKSFGWSSFVPPYKYILSAYCASKSCKMARVSKEHLTKHFESDYSMGYAVMSNLASVMSGRFGDLQKLAEGPRYARTKIIVHLATCGIAAGAREVMKTLQDELYKTDRADIKMESSGCIGKCFSEPNVTVEIEGEEPVIYQKMDSEKMSRVFREHVLKGRVQADLVLAE
jgi:NADP-reducing hydrogenase subunit HndB